MGRDGLRPGRTSAPIGVVDDAEPRSRRDRGQSTVELALVLPVVVMLALAVVQVGLVVRDQIRVVHAAREGARAAAVSAEEQVAAAAVERNGGLSGDRVSVSTRGRGVVGSDVTVVVEYRAPTDLPLVGPLVPDLVLTARATMRVEQ